MISLALLKYSKNILVPCTPIEFSFPAKRFLEEDSSCKEFGCSYSKEGSPGDVFCFKEGPYPTEAGTCPILPTGACHLSL